MTVRDNIHFRQLLFRSGKGIADGGHTVDSKRLEDEPLVRAFELEGHLDKKVAELSTGLRKRVGIVAGMLFDPHVIMLDEPSNAIDPITPLAARRLRQPASRRRAHFAHRHP